MFIGTFDEEREREKGRLEAHREGLKEERKADWKQKRN